MIDEFTAYLCGKSLRSETDLHAFARRRKIVATVFYGHRRTMIGYRRRFVRHAWLIEIFSGRVFDPFTVFVRTERVTADGRLRSDRSIGILDEQIQTKSPVG